MIKIISSVKVTGRRVLVRAGFDVPLKKNVHTEEWEVVDETRIKAILPTLNYLVKNKAKIIIVSHLGRPEGKWNQDKSLVPVAKALARLLDYKFVTVVDRLPDYETPHVNFLTGDITKQDWAGLTKDLTEGDILFLENMRFYPGEEENSSDFVETLASFADLFVNDAFSVAHRKEASTYGIAQRKPAYAGLGLNQEVTALSKVLRSPAHPMILVMGGAKVADKIDTIHNLAKNADKILIGGALANSFFKARGYEIGKSKFSDVSLAKDLLRNYKDKIVLPVDVVVARSEDGQPRCVLAEKILPSEIIYDIGPETIRKFATIIKSGKTLIWNGPMGLIENPKFRFGSLSIARTFAQRAKGKAFGVIGGGETIEAVDQAKVEEYIDHVSMGGGAMLEFLAGKKLPAIKILEK